MKIEEAKICLDCDEIYEGSSYCPNCSGRIGWPLKQWIGTIGREIGAVELQGTSTAELLFGDRSERIRAEDAFFIAHEASERLSISINTRSFRPPGTGRAPFHQDVCSPGFGKPL